MGIRAERLYRSLQSIEQLRQLIGSKESSEVECKGWHNVKDSRAGMEKAACGLANAEGGVIVIGMDARKKNGKDDIQGFQFVSNLSTATSQVYELLAEALEPGLRNLQVLPIPECDGSDSGCILVYIPEEDGLPQRVRGGNFYVRMAGFTSPMLYSQIADRFGRRPHPQLRLVKPTIELDTENYSSEARRKVSLIVVNEGRGSARFPAIRCKKGPVFANLSEFNGPTPVWKFVADSGVWLSFRGYADDVIHPGEQVHVVQLMQLGLSLGEPTKDQFGNRKARPGRTFNAFVLETQVVCEGMPERAEAFEIEGSVYNPEGLTLKGSE